MKETISFILLFILMISYISCKRKFDSNAADWQPAHIHNLDGFVSKQVGTIKYTMQASRSLEEREEIIAETEKNIAECLAMIGETEFNDSLHICLLYNLADAERHFGYHCVSLSGLKEEDYIKERPEYKDTPFISENSIRCIYEYGSEYNLLKGEIMRLILFLKWGYESIEPRWLVYRMSNFVASDFFNCDGLTLEERYAYLLQNNKLLETCWLKNFPERRDEAFISNKAAYNQSAYLVKYLFENYGIEKIKTLWIDGAKAYRAKEQKIYEEIPEEVRSNIGYSFDPSQYGLGFDRDITFLPTFEQVYNISFQEMIEKTNDEIRTKYPDPINLSWEDFERICVE